MKPERTSIKFIFKMKTFLANHQQQFCQNFSRTKEKYEVYCNSGIADMHPPLRIDLLSLVQNLEFGLIRLDKVELCLAMGGLR